MNQLQVGFVVGMQGYSAHMRKHAQERRPSVQRSLQPFLDEAEVGGSQHHSLTDLH